MKATQVQLGVIVVAALLAVHPSQAQGPITGGSGDAIDGTPVSRPAEQVYGNIKALNGLPYGEVVAGMQVMSQALGVDCDYCHTRSGDRDDEGNPNKDVARQMIRMVRELNTEKFGGRNVISCNTCHRGNPVPTDKLDLASRPDVPPATNLVHGLPSVRQVLDK